MKEAFGGIFSFVLLTIFLTIIIGIFALTVSYTKAFKMKNNILSRIEQYQGNLCFDESEKSRCFKKIMEDAESLNYSPTVNLNCPDNYEKAGNYFCYHYNSGVNKDYNYKKYSYNGSDITSTNKKVSCKTYYYDIITQVDVNFPIINKILGWRFFQINGSTRTIIDSNCS